MKKRVCKFTLNSRSIHTVLLLESHIILAAFNFNENALWSQTAKIYNIVDGHTISRSQNGLSCSERVS